MLLILAFCVGFYAGLTLMCLLFAARKGDDEMEQIFCRGWEEMEKYNNQEIEDVRDWLREQRELKHGTPQNNKNPA